MTSQQLGKAAALIMTIGLVCLGCSSDSDDAASSPTATPETSATTDSEIAPATSLKDLVKQNQSNGELNAGVTLKYEEGNGNFSADVDPTDKEAVITLLPDKTWSAYFAADSSTVYTGTYTALSVADDFESIEIEIIHDGTSADGSDNLLTLEDDGTFAELSKDGPGEASGTYTIAAPQATSS